VEKNRKALEDLNTQLTTRQQELDKARKDLEKCHSAMSRFKVAGTAENAISGGRMGTSRGSAAPAATWFIFRAGWGRRSARG